MPNWYKKISPDFQRWLALPSGTPHGHPESTRVELPVLVVGAGPAGLAGIHALQCSQIACQAVESHARVGGIWDHTNPLSSVYEGMHAVTSRYTSHLEAPIPDEWPDFPSHEQVQAYFTQFSQQQQLLRHIRFNTRFDSATKSNRGTWVATLHSQEKNESYQKEFRAIVIATGAHNKNHRLFPETLREQAVTADMKVLHSADYESPAPYVSKRVLVIGIGNSGSDIADKISDVTAQTLLAVRTSPWINPPAVLGTPCDKMGADSVWLPHWYQMGSFHIIRRAYVCHPHRLGLSKPQHRLLDRLPVTDRGIIEAILNRRVLIRSGVSQFADGLAHFEDPHHNPEPIDTVIFATGYGRNYPLLAVESASDQAASDALSFLIFHRYEPGLAYLAEAIGTRSCWPIFNEQARTLAAYFSAEQHGKPNVARFNARRTLPTSDFKGKLFRHADGFHVDYERYTRVLKELAAWFFQ